MCSSRIDYICELPPLGGAPEHEGAAAHVSSPDELPGKAQPESQHRFQRLEVLRRRDTAEQDRGIARLELFRQLRGIALQRAGVAPVTWGDRYPADGASRSEIEDRPGIPGAPARHAALH